MYIRTFTLRIIHGRKCSIVENELFCHTNTVKHCTLSTVLYSEAIILCIPSTPYRVQNRKTNKETQNSGCARVS